MVHRSNVSLRFLDHCLTDSAGLTQLRQALDRIEKCRTAVSKKMNLADVLCDPNNQQALATVFGEGEFDVGIQLCLRFGLEGHQAVNFTLTQGIEGRKKIDFIHRTVGGWQQFDAVIAFCLPESEGHHSMVVVNPAHADHWAQLDAIPSGTVVSIYVRNLRAEHSNVAEDKLALSRYQAVFDTVQHISDATEMQPVPAVRIEGPMGNVGSPGGRYVNGSYTQGGAPAPTKAPQSQARVPTNGTGKPMAPRGAASVAAGKPAANQVVRPRRKPVASSVTTHFARPTSGQAVSGPASFSFKVLVNKMDTFVHAGNAHLICQQIKEYPGRITMSVLRAEKKGVSLDPDTIWSAEIRNGETVLYEFYGPVPAEDFVKELAKKTNKYTQMDKLAG